MRVGFIGLGHMGAAAAANILRAGHRLTVHDLLHSRAQSLLELGATWARSPAEVAEAVDIVLTMVPGPREIMSVMRDTGGVLRGLRRDSIWVDMTTNSPGLFRELADEAQERGCRAIDAPVTGAVDGAIKGRLTLFVGGDERDVALAAAVLQTMGRVLYMGGRGSGTVTKLLTNQLWFISAAAIGEALVLGKKSGIEPNKLWEALQNSVADSFVCRHDVPSIFAGHYDPSFSLDLCCKDLALILQLVDAAGTQADLTRLAQNKFEMARSRYGGTAGELHVCKLIEDAAQVSLRVDGDWPVHWEV